MSTIFLDLRFWRYKCNLTDLSVFSSKFFTITLTQAAHLLLNGSKIVLEMTFFTPVFWSIKLHSVHGKWQMNFEYAKFNLNVLTEIHKTSGLLGNIFFLQGVRTPLHVVTAAFLIN